MNTEIKARTVQTLGTNWNWNSRQVQLIEDLSPRKHQNLKQDLINHELPWWWIPTKTLRPSFVNILHLQSIKDILQPWYIQSLCQNTKVSCYRPGVAQRVGSGIALLFHDCGTRRGWVVSSTPRPHLTPGKDPVPILYEAGWAPGPFWMGGKSRPHRDSIPDRPAHSQSLYRLSYPVLTRTLILSICLNLQKVKHNQWS